jgi:dTDP-4-dehydrorhamnose 3,5-epimerase
MRFSETSIPGVVVIQPQVHRDPRGFFLETFHAEKFTAGGVPAVFVQDNHSSSVRDTVRGLHMQRLKPQGKLVRVVEGKIWDVAVDLRTDSPTYGQWTAMTLSADGFEMLYIPEGCAHGFCVLSDVAQVQYKCTALYDPADEIGIAWNDPDLAIDWPVTTPILSARDRSNPPLAQIADLLRTASARG